MFSVPNTLHLILFLLYCFVFSYQQACNHQDQSALLSFLSNISTAPSIPLNWSSSISCCRWEGIKCDINGRVTHLQLPSRGLEGSITSSISSLAMLTHLNLSNNYLHGPLEVEIPRLTNLRVLDLSSNSILGFIPKEIGNLSYLKKLHLYDNNLSGPIPSSLMNCTNLTEILLRDNYLNGDISKLDFSSLVQLQKLDLRTNSLKGSLPESIYSCKSLVAISVALNMITGQISPKIVELKSLSFISLGVNSFTNITGTLQIFAKSKSLTTLFLSSNFIGESLPTHRNFVGSGGFSKLQFFALQNCEFVAGPIPNWLHNLKSLRVLGLKGNRMTGRVPSWLGTLPNLFTLELNNNSLSGKLPLELCQLPALISQNVQADLKFSLFELPVFLTNNKKIYIRSKADYYYGLGLSYNAFSGSIPEEIGNLQNLQELFLNNNHFSGQIPSSMSNLKRLEMLNLSTNNLSGEIPTSLESLSFLSRFDVSHNDLEGPIPAGGQFGTFRNSSFEGNRDLCGEPLNRPCSSPATSRDGSRDHNNMRWWFVDGLFVGFASGFVSTLVFVASYVCFKFNTCKRLNFFKKRIR